jgi:hypothetical protein
MALVESAAKQVVSKRFVEKNQYAGLQRGAHPLRQIRTQVLQGDGRSTRSRWYARMQSTPKPPNP